MKRSKYSLSEYRLLTGDFGQLIPIYWGETLPGDTWQMSTSILCRLSPLLTPVLHPCMLRVHHFWCPNRGLWDDWEDWITGGEDGLNANVHPKSTAASVAKSTLKDYLDWPVDTYGGSIAVNALPIRMYQSTWNEYYRDEQLGSKVAVDKTDGEDATSLTLQRVSWPKDYITSARPNEQLGTEVTVSLGSTAPLAGLQYQNIADTGTMLDVNDGSAGSSAANSRGVSIDVTQSGHPKAWVDLSSATGISINDLRLSNALQKYMENRNLYGARYVEYIRSLGVRKTEVDKPIYIGGGRSVLQFSEVVSTSEDGTREAGILRGHGIGAMRTNRFRKFFDEHGIIMSFLSVVPKPIYTQGFKRKFFRTTKEDYWQKELQHVGDQELTNKEVYAAHSSPDGTWGYQRRYDEYRSGQSSVSGEFSDTGTYTDWHLGRIHTGDVALNSSFVQCTPTKRIFADSSAPAMQIMAAHSIQARRLVTKSTAKRIG